MLYAILDTNFFLHWEPLDQYDWAKELGADEVTLVIVPPVFSELERKKMGGASSRVMERARQRSTQLSRWLDEVDGLTVSIHAGAKLLFETRSSLIDYAAQGLVREVVDDQIIASILQFRSEKPDANILLITNDLNLRTKARAQKIPARAPPGEPLNDPDPKDEELRKARAELSRYENARPQLLLQLGPGTRSPLPLVPLTNQQVEQLGGFARHFYMHSVALEASFIQAYPGELAVAPGFRRIHREKAESYATKLEAYARELGLAQRQALRTMFLELVLVNDGRKPARNLDIFIKVASPRIRVFLYSEIPPQGAPPEPPMPLDILPREFAADLTSKLAMPAWPAPPTYALDQFGPGMPVQLLSIDEPYRVRAHFKVEDLKHGHSRTLRPLVLLAGEPESFDRVVIEYVISCDELMDKVPGTVIFETREPVIAEASS